MSTQDWLGLVLVVVMVLALAGRLVSLGGRYRRGGAGDRRMVAQAQDRQRSVADLAAVQGWSVVAGEQATGATLDPALRSSEVEIGGRDFSVVGDGFRADSWMAYTGRVGSPLRYSFRLVALHVDAPGTRGRASIGVMPLPRQPILFPESLRHQVVTQSPGALVMAGDVEPALPALSAILPEIEQRRLWVVLQPDEVVVLADREPTADDLRGWLDLGFRIRDAVSGGAAG